MLAVPLVCNILYINVLRYTLTMYFTVHILLCRYMGTAYCISISALLGWCVSEMHLAHIIAHRNKPHRLHGLSCSKFSMLSRWIDLLFIKHLFSVRNAIVFADYSQFIMNLYLDLMRTQPRAISAQYLNHV